MPATTKQLEHCQREIIPVATFVVGLEGVAAHGYGPAIGQVAEGAVNWRRSGINDRYDKEARRKSGRAIIAQRKESIINRDT